MRYSGPVFRAHNPTWAWAPASGEGARRFGGRFNRQGLPALYTALTPLAALREASPVGRPMEPILLCDYAVDAQRVLDATDAATRAAYGIAPTDLACPNWRAEMLQGQVPASQALADRMIAAGFAAMIAPSYARGASPDARIMVFWQWGDRPPSQIRVIDTDGRLPAPPGG